MAATIWSSKTTIADTRNASRAACAMSGLPPRCGYPIRRSVPPGRTCARSASCWSIMTACGSAGSKMRPATTLTRSIETPSPPAGLASATMSENGDAPGPGRDICRNAAVRRRRHLRQAAQRRGSSRRNPDSAGHHQQVRGVAVAQEAGVGGVGAPGAGRGGQRDAADHAEQHGQREPRPPLVAQLGPQAQPDRSHGRHSFLRRRPGQGCRHPRPWGCCPPRAPGGAGAPERSPGGACPRLKAAGQQGAPARPAWAAARPSLGHAVWC